MDNDDYRQANIHVALVANTIEALPLDEMLEMQSRAETIGAFLDPTAFMRKGKDLRIDGERMRILRDAQVRLKRLRAENT